MDEQTSNQNFGTLFKPKISKKGSALFSHKTGPSEEDLRNITNQVNNSILRLRVLEEHYSTLNRRAQLTDQSLIRVNKRLSEEIRILNSDVSEIKMSIDEIKDKVLLIIKEVKSSPRREEFEILRKYIEMWQPVNFVTQKEIESIVEDVVSRYSKGKTSAK